MLEKLDAFVKTLQPEIQEQVSGRKARMVIHLLEESGIDIPQEVYDELEQVSIETTRHDALMSAMREFQGNTLSSVPNCIVKI